MEERPIIEIKKSLVVVKEGSNLKLYHKKQTSSGSAKFQIQPLRDWSYLFCGMQPVIYILRYATCSIPLYFPIITCAQQFTGVLLRTFQKPSPKLFNSCEPLRTYPIISENFPMIPKHFRRFPKIFRKF